MTLHLKRETDKIASIKFWTRLAQDCRGERLLSFNPQAINGANLLLDEESFIIQHIGSMGDRR
ncbi:hypothetical protein ACQ4M4_13330 [Leptolyngbya sp. AN02str]|uniref:hypothetical protein n=1 Tax=Leptolyngbya sp. AN02str TaxID=3423363 RepID=UPI003D316E4E